MHDLGPVRSTRNPSNGKYMLVMVAIFDSFRVAAKHLSCLESALDRSSLLLFSGWPLGAYQPDLYLRVAVGYES